MPASLAWFRLWQKTLDCPKVQGLDGDTFKAWVNLMCLASRQAERGCLPGLQDIAFGVRLTERKTTSVLNKLIDVRLIDRDGDTLKIHDWEEWQQDTSGAAERMRNYRDRHKKVNTETVKALRALPYEDYLQSPHWLAIRQLALESSKMRCQLCNSPDNLHVHHRTYERLGCERLKDLISLCRSCHERFHQANGIPKNPQEATTS